MIKRTRTAGHRDGESMVARDYPWRADGESGDTIQLTKIEEARLRNHTFHPDLDPEWLSSLGAYLREVCATSPDVLQQMTIREAIERLATIESYDPDWWSTEARDWQAKRRATSRDYRDRLLEQPLDLPASDRQDRRKFTAMERAIARVVRNVLPREEPTDERGVPLTKILGSERWTERVSAEDWMRIGWFGAGPLSNLIAKMEGCETGRDLVIRALCAMCNLADRRDPNNRWNGACHKVLREVAEVPVQLAPLVRFTLDGHPPLTQTELIRRLGAESGEAPAPTVPTLDVDGGRVFVVMPGASERTRIMSHRGDSTATESQLTLRGAPGRILAAAFLTCRPKLNVDDPQKAFNRAASALRNSCGLELGGTAHRPKLPIECACTTAAHGSRGAVTS